MCSMCRCCKDITLVQTMWFNWRLYRCSQIFLMRKSLSASWTEKSRRLELYKFPWLKCCGETKKLNRLR
ncbi:hypothetical protein EPI10_005899 [Gossypium australe]|uniref:Uncharacterized protein n=1 Tax=Gossypium australe TaxID=47621 RepID=A0A5B6WQR0_9ROSI|nr:hypothetical protein EPI10_005899 [Gossypium australe]